MLFCEWGYFYTRKFALVSSISRWVGTLGKGSGLQANYYLFESGRRAVQFPRKTRSICRLEYEGNLISIEYTVSIRSKQPNVKCQYYYSWDPNQKWET